MGYVVISHLHGDHTGGLPAVASYSPGASVVLPEHYGVNWVKSTGLIPIVNEETTRITDNVWVSEPLPAGNLREQCLSVGEPGKLLVLVGCSHPGTDALVEKVVSDIGGVAVVAGGMHLAGATSKRVAEVVDKLVRLGIRRLYPLHCSGDTVIRYALREYPWLLGKAGAGSVIRF